MKTILHVDDSETMRAMTSMIFSKFARVVFANDGCEGYELYMHEKPDLIITDINMPCMNGIELIKKIRSTDSETAIIVLTTESEKTKIEEGLALGANGWIKKPFKPLEIAEQISRFLEIV